MNPANALFTATGFAYLALAIFTFIGKDALVGIHRNIEIIFYLGAFMVFMYVANNPPIRNLNFFLGAFYGVGAIGSFIGYPQRWKAYWKSAPQVGSDAGQIGMALWDLSLSIAFFSLC